MVPYERILRFSWNPECPRGWPAEERATFVLASVYGCDTLKRYGPQLLYAWECELSAPLSTAVPAAAHLNKAGFPDREQPRAETKIAPGFEENPC